LTEGDLADMSILCDTLRSWRLACFESKLVGVSWLASFSEFKYGLFDHLFEHFYPNMAYLDGMIVKVSTTWSWMKTEGTISHTAPTLHIT
jgi:hypothetical protein